MEYPTARADAQGRQPRRVLAPALMAAALALVASPTVFAGEHGDMSKSGQNHSQDKSQQMNKAHDRDFTAADRDGDGRLDRNEYDAMRSDSMRKHQQEQLSRNEADTGMSRNDGASAPAPGEGVPATDHQANVLRNFEDHDRDGDGYVSFEEFDMQARND